MQLQVKMLCYKFIHEHAASQQRLSLMGVAPTNLTFYSREGVHLRNFVGSIFLSSDGCRWGSPALLFPHVHARYCIVKHYAMVPIGEEFL